MALTKEQITQLRNQYGINPVDALTKSSSTPTETGTARDFGYLGSVISKASNAIKDTYTESKKMVDESSARMKANAGQEGALAEGIAETGRTALGATAKALGGAGGVIASLVPDWLTQLVDKGSKGLQDVGTQFRESNPELATSIDKVVSDIDNSPLMTSLVQKTKENPDLLPVLGDAINTVLAGYGFEKGAPKVAETFGKVKETIPVITDKAKGVVSSVADTTKTGIESAKNSLFSGKTKATNADQVVQQASETLKPSEVLAKTEQATAQPTILEKWAGISPDIKNRIAGKAPKLQEYFDVAHARNNFDTLPTPLEYGAKNVEGAVSKMEGVLNDTGSEIGKFRKTVGTYEAPIDSVAKIENSFTSQLDKLNLEVKDGAIRQKPGKVTRVNSDAEIKTLNDLYEELRTVKENPNLEKLIDLRNIFDGKINFGKSSREVSSSLDPLSRTVRKQIADVSAEIVGKEQAANLTKYSEFIDAYNELKGFTDRKAGAEFLLKQVLSEKGGGARSAIQTIKEFTGIDLMDDAVMSSIATDLIGNSRQKGVFRQELTKAGLDAQAILQGDITGAINLMLNRGKKLLLNEEKQFMNAAK